MRLGELLLKQQLVTSAALQEAVDAQRVYGRRLGTNLVQRGAIDVDVLARALSEQQGVPAALRAHFAAIDRRVLAIFPIKIVTAHKAIPIGYTAAKPPRLIVACVDPAKVPAEELAFAAGCRVDLAVAPEILIDDCLDEYYGVPRPKSPYVDVTFGASAPASSVSLARAKVVEPAPPPAAKSKKRRKSTPARALSPPPPPPSTTHAARLLTPPPAPTFAEIDVEAQDAWQATALEEEVEAIVASRPLTAPPGAMLPVIDPSEASRIIEMATTKDQVGRALVDWMRSAFGCGLVLVVKGDRAVGWKGFFADAEDMIEAVTIPLAKPSVLTPASESRATFVGPPSEEGAKVNGLVWKVLRCAPPAEVLVCPVTMGDRAVSFLYSHADAAGAFGDEAARDASALARDAATAYARLIKKKK